LGAAGDGLTGATDYPEHLLAQPSNVVIADKLGLGAINHVEAKAIIMNE
jgi:hypothetical protein